MTLNDQTIVKQRAFETTYMFAKPYDGYVNGCSLQTVSFLERIHGDLGLDRQPEDLCLYVFLERELPQGMRYPNEFSGIPVLVKVVREIRDEELIYESTDEPE